jgi:mRNA interferase YafQ
MRKALGREFEIETFIHVTELLAAGQPVPGNFKPHALSGEWAGYSEFHLDADRLVIYQVRRDEVVFWRSGTHRELFGGLR